MTSFHSIEELSKLVQDCVKLAVEAENISAAFRKQYEDLGLEVKECVFDPIKKELNVVVRIPPQLSKTENITVQISSPIIRGETEEFVAGAG